MNGGRTIVCDHCGDAFEIRQSCTTDNIVCPYCKRPPFAS
jgi:uncharacterized protein YbaR (Trm112 family)